MTETMTISNSVMETLKRVTTGMVMDALAISGIQGGHRHTSGQRI